MSRLIRPARRTRTIGVDTLGVLLHVCKIRFCSVGDVRRKYWRPCVPEARDLPATVYARHGLGPLMWTCTSPVMPESGEPSFAGFSRTEPPFRHSFLTSNSPATAAMTTRFWDASRDRPSTSRSPSWMPSLEIESPEAVKKNVAAGLRTKCSCRWIVDLPANRVLGGRGKASAHLREIKRAVSTLLAWPDIRPSIGRLVTVCWSSSTTTSKEEGGNTPLHGILRALKKMRERTVIREWNQILSDLLLH